jgi:hypothetical protein
MSRSAPPLLLPRGLIFLASLWLIASWIIALGWRTPVQPSSASFTPGVRLMLLCMAIGLLIGWPLLRLSQSRPWYPLRQTMLDLMVLLGLVQVVIWPLRLVTNWTPLRTAAIDATLAGWLLLAGAMVAAGVTTDRTGPRVLSMLACMAMCLLGPALAWLGMLTGVQALELVSLSPFMAIRTLSEGIGTHPTATQWTWIGLLWFAVAAVWTALIIGTAAQGRWRRGEPDRTSTDTRTRSAAGGVSDSF